MNKLWITGLGPGTADTITIETMEILKRADKVILRTDVHPAAADLKAMNIPYCTCDHFYETGKDFDEVYQNIASFVLQEALQNAEVCYCVPGHPGIAEDTVTYILNKINNSAQNSRMGEEQVILDVEVLTAVSFLDSVLISLGIDPIKQKLMILDAAALYDGDKTKLLPLPEASCLFAQVYHPFIASELKLALLDEVPPDAEAVILYHTGIPGEEETLRCSLAELDHVKRFDHLTTVYLPLYNQEGKRNRLERTEGNAEDYPLRQLVDVFRRLLAPDGCPWDREQTHETLKPYLLEEAQEVLEAIDEMDMEHLKEELGDVLMQIVFHSALAESRGDFDINDVIAGITDKMIRRHPHVFGEAKADTPEDVAILWQQIKEEEKN